MALSVYAVYPLPAINKSITLPARSGEPAASPTDVPVKLYLTPS